ncbi:MAG: TIGR03571 family LLM class oxidoreductase [Pseudomonadota bacterium]
MPETAVPPARFPKLNAGYRMVFSPGRLSIGLVVPIEAYASTSVPSLAQHLERVQLAEALGFSAVWLRDVPFDVPSFGDAGQLFDPFVYLGALAMQTQAIALGVASIILPLRHPAHVAKAAASADVLSNGRLLLGIASGDRPEEYPALDVPFDQRGRRFRDSYAYIRQVAESRPQVRNAFGDVTGDMDLLPKPVAGKLPLLITGASQQDPAWLAAHGDGWITYPRPVAQQARFIRELRARAATGGAPERPVMEPLYIDLAERPDAPPQPLHLGFRLGIDALRSYLEARQAIGVNHVALNLRFNRLDPRLTLERLAEALLPDFTH